MMQPSFGEIFLTSDEVSGGMENIQLFKGKLISSLCGGCTKLFVIEDGSGNEGVISTLHSPEQDQEDKTFTDEQEVFRTFDDKGQIRKIVSGKKHTVFMTDTGQLYSYGFGEYGSLGHGGLIQTPIPKQINKLAGKRVTQLCCGEFHTIVLTSDHDMFSWGRGFEGQLGIRKEIDTASSPMFVSYFYKNPAVFIASGAYHSLAINAKGQLYGWGEARFGQLGNGKNVKETIPRLILLAEHEEQGVVQSQFKINPLNNLVNEVNPKVVTVAGGYAHTVAITDHGELYTWGFNQRGQLGQGDQKSRYHPKKVTKDLLGNQVPLFSKVACGYYTTYAIDLEGRLWSWGGGNLGFKNENLIDLPRRIVENIADRKFTEILANGQAAAFFAGMRIMSLRPNYGPSCGGTLITLIGAGFCDTGRQSVRFTFGKGHVQEVSCEYDEQTDSFRCGTPRFEELGEDESIHWPMECKVEVTLDGSVYIGCEQQFLIYSSKLAVSQMFPKCASVEGGTTLMLNINIDEKTASYMKHLNVGFQPRAKKEKSMKESQWQGKQGDLHSKQPSQTDLTKKISQHSNNLVNNLSPVKQLNPLDLSTNDPELEKENWICVEGFYEKGKITCVVPRVCESSIEMLNYNVDISINGQQFSGNPVVFRFYDIKVNQILPDNVMSDGGTAVKILGEGFFDTSNKKVIFKTQFGERLIEIQWDKQERCYQLVAPPITWLLGGQQVTNELLQEVKNEGVDVMLTLSGVEWINIGKFYYIDPEVVRIAPAQLDMTLSEEERKAKWLRAEEEVDVLSAIQNEAERAKKAEELRKLLESEDQEIAMMFKKSGQYLYLFGQNFIQTESLTVQFIYGGDKARLTKGVYKNKSRVGVQIPELDELGLGIHEVIVEISLNGQSFSHSNKQIKVMGFDKAMSAEQRQKYEDEEIKKLKKTVPAKKH